MSEFTGVCQCANKTVSLRGSPPGFAKQARPLCQNCARIRLFVPLGLALSEKQTPQIIENTEKPK